MTLLEFAERLEPSARLIVSRDDDWLYDSVPGGLKVKDGRNYEVVTIRPLANCIGVEVEVREKEHDD